MSDNGNVLIEWMMGFTGSIQYICCADFVRLAGWVATCTATDLGQIETKERNKNTQSRNYSLRFLTKKMPERILLPK